MKKPPPGGKSAIEGVDPAVLEAGLLEPGMEPGAQAPPVGKRTLTQMLPPRASEIHRPPVPKHVPKGAGPAKADAAAAGPQDDPFGLHLAPAAAAAAPAAAAARKDRLAGAIKPEEPPPAPAPAAAWPTLPGLFDGPDGE